jgi:hypothetical protein
MLGSGANLGVHLFDSFFMTLSDSIYLILNGIKLALLLAIRNLT